MSSAFKEKSVITGYNGRHKRKDKKFRKKYFEPIQIIKHYTYSEELTEAEKEVINSMDDVIWTPKNKYSHLSFSREAEPWEIMGFISRHHYAGWLNTCRLTNEMFVGFEVDLLHKKTSGEMSDNY